MIDARRQAALLRVCALMILAATWSADDLRAAERPDEQQLIDVLQSTASLQQKNDACAQLKRAGTARSVSALAALLPDKDLSHSARYALESMQQPEAGTALIDALDKTDGLTKAGIVHSLEVRNESRVRERLITLLVSDDAMVAAAAASAVGAMGGDRAHRQLLDALHTAKNSNVRAAIYDAVIASGYRMLLAGNRSLATEIFESLAISQMPAHVRKSAHMGILSAADDARALQLVAEAMKGSDAPARQAALEFSRRLKSTRTPGVLTDVLLQAKDPVLQVAIIEELRQRADRSAAPALRRMVAHDNALVRIASVTALGELDDATAVPFLVRAAGSSDEAERKAAQQALAVIRGSEVTEQLVKELAGSQGDSRRAILRALAVRGDKSASDRLLKLARSGDAPARTAALQALVRVARNEDLAAVVALLAESEDPAGMAEVSRTIAQACSRIRNEGGTVDATPIVKALGGSNPQVLTTLLPVAGMLNDERLHRELRSALDNSQPAIREAAEKALCEARDAELFPDLVKLAGHSKDADRQVQAVRSCLRIVNESDGSTTTTADQRVARLAEILAVAPRVEEKWSVLGSLAETSTTKALNLATGLLDDPATRAEAVQAVTKIADAIKQNEPKASRAALAKAVELASDPEQRKRATAVLDLVSTATVDQ